MDFSIDRSYAQRLDIEDSLRKFREEFCFPVHQGEKCVYFCGNSLGLQHKRSEGYVVEELKKWRSAGVEGHFTGERPWMDYHEFLTEHLALLVGAKSIEVVAMNSLTTNLHLMMVSFYRPTPQKNKILIEGGAFPSDRYAVESQIRFHDYEPETSLLEISPRPGEKIIRQEDILQLIEEQGDSIALVLLGGVNYYTGQVFAIEEITKIAHQKQCEVGIDLAHAIGNIPLNLHDWQVDFAVWCSYKYLNGGPGGVGGAFVHEKYAHNKELPRFSGWWGHEKTTRFKMPDEFILSPGVEGWQLSNAPVLSMATLLPSLEVFSQIGITALREKSVALTSYLEFLLKTKLEQHVDILTPKSSEERGAQLSLCLKNKGKEVHQSLLQRGVVCDWREPDSIRVAPVPLYNSFEDVWKFVTLLKEIVA